MQFNIIRLQAFSQQTRSFKEAEMPSFEEAFDTESLRKFFLHQQLDPKASSHFISESPIFDDTYSTTQDPMSRFQSPLSLAMRKCPEEAGMSDYSLGPDLEEGLGTNLFIMRGWLEDESPTLKGFTHEERGRKETDIHKLVFQKKDADGKMEMETGMKRVLLDFTEEKPQEGELQIQQVTEVESLGTLGLESLETKAEKEEKWTSQGRSGKKPVFIIERNVTPAMISKIKKEKKKRAKKSAEEKEKEEDDMSMKNEDEISVKVEKTKKKKAKKEVSEDLEVKTNATSDGKDEEEEQVSKKDKKKKAKKGIFDEIDVKTKEKPATKKTVLKKTSAEKKGQNKGKDKGAKKQ